MFKIVVTLLACALALGCGRFAPSLELESVMVRSDGAIVTTSTLRSVESGWQLFFGDRYQTRLADGTTDQGISKAPTSSTLTNLGNTAGGVALGYGAGSLVGVPIAGAAIGGGAGAIADTLAKD